MSDLIRLEHGQLPWKPTVDSQNIRVYDEYDIPLTGVIQQDGCFYLFNCSAGRLQLGSMWFYNLISSADLAALDDLEGEEFEKYSSERASQDRLIATKRGPRSGC